MNKALLMLAKPRLTILSVKLFLKLKSQLQRYQKKKYLFSPCKSFTVFNAYWNTYVQRSPFSIL